MVEIDSDSQILAFFTTFSESAIRLSNHQISKKKSKKLS